MRVVAVIPARYGSTRFPGKPLHKISGKPLLQWVIEGVKGCADLDHLIVATDHEGISSLARSLSVEVAMTDPSLPSGSDRVFAAIQNQEADVVLNIQGDEPLIRPEVVSRLIQPFRENSELDMATLARPSQKTDLESDTTAKIVLDANGYALYFSRYPIPYSRINWKDSDSLNGCLTHIGLYGYKKSFLEAFCRQAPTVLELSEGLEQLRALYLGAQIKVEVVEHESWGVDTPEDVNKIERLLEGFKV